LSFIEIVLETKMMSTITYW